MMTVELTADFIPAHPVNAEVQEILEAWNKALNLSLKYMQSPKADGLSDSIVGVFMDMPMATCAAFYAPLIKSNPAPVKMQRKQLCEKFNNALLQTCMSLNQSDEFHQNLHTRKPS